MSRNKLTLKTGSARAKTVGKATNASMSRTIRVRTMSLKDIQESFKPNPASLEEILSSKSSNDADRKRSQTLIGSGIKRHSYRVEKPRDSRTSLYTGALRVPRNNNLKKENRRTMGGNTLSNSRLSTLRESNIPLKREIPKIKLNVNKINQSFASRSSKMQKDLSTNNNKNKNNIRKSLAIAPSVLRSTSKKNEIRRTKAGNTLSNPRLSTLRESNIPLKREIPKIKLNINQSFASRPLKMQQQDLSANHNNNNNNNRKSLAIAPSLLRSTSKKNEIRRTMIGNTLPNSRLSTFRESNIPLKREIPKIKLNNNNINQSFVSRPLKMQQQDLSANNSNNNNNNNNIRKSLAIAPLAMRSNSNKKNEIRKSLAATSLAIRDTMLETTRMIKPVQRVPSSMTRRMTTSLINKESGVPTIEIQQMKQIQQNSVQQQPSQPDNPQILYETVIEPMKRLSLKSNPVSTKVTKVSNENHLPTVEQFRLYEELEELEKQLELEISEDLADI
ncbi:hypothetical protein Glove_65g67 [Diversispora epigaea]|uniref:Uncharacterized protein n=1 Tax=Diversispora epigaea TaxID=1348612 RepID=A0A397JLQ0_9GLOM|nr:hypothetical protein Glove_65g67 [Diversispora epigaea]